MFSSALPRDVTWLRCDSVCLARLDRVLCKHRLMTGKFFKDCATPPSPHASLRQYQADQSVRRSPPLFQFTLQMHTLECYRKSDMLRAASLDSATPPPPPPRVPLHVSLKASLGCPINTVAERVKASMSWLPPSAAVMKRHLCHRPLQKAQIFGCFSCCNHCC